MKDGVLWVPRDVPPDYCLQSLPLYNTDTCISMLPLNRRRENSFESFQKYIFNRNEALLSILYLMIQNNLGRQITACSFGSPTSDINLVLQNFGRTHRHNELQK